MKYNAIVKMFAGGQQLNIGSVEIEADVVKVGQSGSLEFYKLADHSTRADGLILAVPPGMWLHCEEARLVNLAPAPPPPSLKLV